MTAARDPDPIGTRIVAAAAKLIVSEGFDGASTAAIARAAGTSKRAIYERFPSKHALFEGVIAHLCALRAEEQQQGGAAPSAPADDLESAMRGAGVAVLTRFCLPETRGILVAAFGATPRFPSALEIFWSRGPGQAVEAVATALEAAKARGEVSVAQPRRAAERYLYDCCGPVVLKRLFDAAYRPSAREIRDQVDAALARHLDALGSAAQG